MGGIGVVFEEASHYFQVELLEKVKGLNSLFVSVIQPVWAEYLVEFFGVIVMSYTQGGVNVMTYDFDRILWGFLEEGGGQVVKFFIKY